MDEREPITLKDIPLILVGFPAMLFVGTVFWIYGIYHDVRDWISDSLGINVTGRDTEWSAREIYVALPRPGGDAWLSIERGDGAVRYESTDRGWIAYLNDLHKGRHTGRAWSWFIDIFAAACFVFSATGLLLLQIHAGKRPSTWPIVAAGLIIPVLLLVILVHH